MMAGAILKARTLWAHIYTNVKVEVLVTLSRPPLCDPRNHSPPGSSVHGILQVEYWSGLLFPPPGDIPNPGIEPTSPALAGGFFTTALPGNPSLVLCSPNSSHLSLSKLHFCLLNLLRLKKTLFGFPSLY